MTTTPRPDAERVHPLLARQLQDCFGSDTDVPAELRSFVAEVGRTYAMRDEELAAFQVTMTSTAEINQALSLLSATLESTADGILVVDRHGKMVQMNRKFVELWRIPEHIVESRDDGQAIEFVLDQLVDPTQFVDKVHELYEKPHEESFDVLAFKDGRTFERYSLPQRVGGEIAGRVWSFRDVTTRRQLEEQLRQSQKMEAIGELAGGVAHDFNNLLTVIRGHAEFLRQSRELSVAERNDVDQIASAADRAAGLTRHLLAFSRKQMMQPVPLDLSDVVRMLAPMLRRMIGEDVQIAINCGATGIVIADLGQMEQVLLNLVLNARDAMPAGGQLEIATANVELEEWPAHVATRESPSGPYVVLSVSDTGCGIAPELRERVFEPFFTTKGVGEGTGLGLSTVFGIVKQSGGQVALQSVVGQGSVFRIYLPRVERDSADVPDVARAREAVGGSETILLVEDEDSVRALVRRILESHGYAVIPARDGIEALSLASQHPRQIDLLLSDVIMPRMGGLELSVQVRRARPGIRVLFMSGYTDTEIDRRGVLSAEAALLEKPFTADALALAVRVALSANV